MLTRKRNLTSIDDNALGAAAIQGIQVSHVPIFRTSNTQDHLVPYEAEPEKYFGLVGSLVQKYLSPTKKILS